MAGENIYPIITQDKVLNNLSKIRITSMMDRITEIKKQLKHYKKLKHRWGVAQITARVSGLTIAGILSVGGSVIGFVTTGGLVVPLVLTGSAALEGVISEIIADGLCLSKKNKFNDKCKIIEDTLNRLYIFIQKASEDNIIDNKELDEYYKIIEAFNKGISDIKIDNTKLKEKAFLEIERERMDQLKKRIKSKVNIKCFTISCYNNINIQTK